MFFKRIKGTIPQGYDILSLLEFSRRPDDLQKIAIWLSKRGEILCSPQQLEIFWIFFSHRFFEKDWITPTRRNIRKFANWNNTLTLR
jgi:hypothetical protein